MSSPVFTPIRPPIVTPVIVHNNNQAHQGAPTTVQDVRAFVVFIAVALIWIAGLIVVSEFF